MDLFEFDRDTFTVKPTEEALLLKPFSAIWKRDKTKIKTKAIKELAYTWFWCHVRSPFIDMSEGKKLIAIPKDLGLEKGWKADKVVLDAIKYFNTHKSLIEEMYEGTIIAGKAVTKVCKEAGVYIEAADDKIAAAKSFNSIIKEMPISMQKLSEAKKLYLKEVQDNAGKQKGSQTFNTYEDMKF